jgi:hypothetical protein
LLQKEQEQELQQQLLMKKNKTSKSSMESRLEAKQKKADMLKKSLQLQIAKGRGHEAMAGARDRMHAL